jgi:hypothetical protein
MLILKTGILLTLYNKVHTSFYVQFQEYQLKITISKLFDILIIFSEGIYHMLQLRGSPTFNDHLMSFHAT